MRASYQWLRELVPLPWTPEEIAEILTAVGLEVEAVEDWRGRYAGFVVGVVTHVEPHPVREGLWVCRVGVGEELQIVAGVAPRQGQRGVVALPGAVLPRTGMRIGVKPIAGVDSQGMLCSQWELGLGEEADEIWSLPEDAPVGAPLVQYLPQLEDVLYEVALTPNRGDCASHVGLARELAAYGRLPLQVPEAPSLEVEPAPVEVSIHVGEGCPFYACALVEGTVARQAPLWMQVRLWQLGMRPHSLPVDVMNYVMLERGQPLHAFDFSTIAQGRVLVRWAYAGEPFTGLDGRSYELCPEDIVIADPEKPLALGGVLGGWSSQVTEATRDVLIEAAVFHPVRIRRTARRYALETEAAYRFQRGVDPQQVVPALRRASWLLTQLGGGRATAPVVQGELPGNSRRILLRYDRLERVLGVRLPAEQVQELLQRLGFAVEGEEARGCLLRVPSFRRDVTEEIDLIEEVARLYGYDRIPASEAVLLPLNPQPLPSSLQWMELQQPVIDALVGWGFQQVFTPVLMDPETARQWSDGVVRLLNALGEDTSALRPSLVPSLVRVLSHNVRVGERTVWIFELGKVFRCRGSGEELSHYEERLQLGILMSGAAVPLQWGSPQREVDFYDLRGVVEQLCERLRIGQVRWEPWVQGRPEPVLPVAVRIFCGDVLLGWLGQLRPRWLKRWEVEQPAYVAVLDMEALQACVQPVPSYTPVPEYPAIRRDLAFVVDSAVPASVLLELIRRCGGELLEEVTLFDVFQSPALGEGKRSMAFALRFRSRQGTLREEEVNPILERIIAEVERQTGATLRR